MTVRAAPGWFGKLPGMGDFAHRRLPDPFREQLDRWLHDGLLRLRERHDDWTARYLEGPLWFFVLGEGVAGPRAWLGVLMPSVDGVGRYFPFIVAAECATPPAVLDAAAWRWWRLAADAALQGLAEDLDAERFDAALQRRLDGDVGDAGNAASGEATPQDLAGPERGATLWLTDPAVDAGRVMRTGGLPSDARFDALFGFAGEGGLEKADAA